MPLTDLKVGTLDCSGVSAVCLKQRAGLLYFFLTKPQRSVACFVSIQGLTRKLKPKSYRRTELMLDCFEEENVWLISVGSELMFGCCVTDTVSATSPAAHMHCIVAQSSHLSLFVKLATSSKALSIGY